MNDPVTVLSDEHLLIVQALVKPAAFAAIYDFYAARVYTYMHYRANDTPTAEDLTARTFEQALVNLHQYQAEKGPFAAWLFGIARNVVSHHYRSQRRFRWLPLERLSNQASDHPPPEESILNNERDTQLMRAVARLTDRERDLVALKFAAGMPNRQIAEMTGLSESNVGVILYRSLKRLRCMLDEGDKP